MNHSPLSRQKKKSGPLIRIVFWLSLLLLVVRLIWVLPAALDHHRTKQDDNGADPKVSAPSQAKPSPNS